MKNEVKINRRDSNIELLRIFAMLLIIISHITSQAETQITDKTSIARMGNGLFCNPVFYKKLYIIDAFYPSGQIGNAIFILITGYFLANRGGCCIKIGSTAKKLLLQLGFSSIVLTVASTILILMNHDGRYLNLINLSQFNTGAWFVGYYFIVILIGKLWLNDFLGRLDFKKYAALVICLFAFSSFQWSGTVADNLATGIRTIIAGLFLYSFGGFVHKYNYISKIKTYVFVLLIVLMYVLIYISHYNVVQTSIENYIRTGSTDLYIQQFLGYPTYSIVPLSMGICWFEIFRRIRIPYNGFINFLGKSTFMAYLMHQNPLGFSIFDLNDWVTLLYYNPAKYIGTVILWTLIVFFIGVAVYCLYIGLGYYFKKHKDLFVTA